MNINIGGKPLNEWIEEQKKKDGVLLVHRGTTRNAFGTSTYHGSIVTLDDKDICYYDADISIRINGKEYRMTGNKVERKSGVWYVDGSVYDLPEQSTSKGMEDTIDNIGKTIDEAMESVSHAFGSFNIANDYVGDVVINHGGKVNRRQVIMHGNGTVKVHRGDKTYTIRGNNIEKRDGKWYADGKPVDWDSIGGKYEESDVVRIEINGSVSNLATTSGDVVVNGSVSNLRTGSGDVQCQTASNVSTGSGDVHCKHITGMCSTGSGDIYR